MKSTHDHLVAAHKKGEKEYLAAVVEETAAWEGGILGAALGAAVAGGAVCSWTGPGTIACSLAGFAGGFVVGSASAALSSKAVRETLTGADRIIASISHGAQAAADVLNTGEEFSRHGITSLQGVWFHEMIETNAKLATFLWEIDQERLGESTTNALVVLFSEVDTQLEEALDNKGSVAEYLKLAQSPVKDMGVTEAELEALIKLVNSNDDLEIFPYSASTALELPVGKLHDAFWKAILGWHLADPEFLADRVIEQVEHGKRELPTSSWQLNETLTVNP